jgi:hypothetical protein|tara:strand:- start:1043 stop:1219 length:177 start_codon:yes stop_codon:yes gene_type:complete
VKFELIDKRTKEIITTREMGSIKKLRIAEVIFGMLKKLNKKKFRELYEVKETKEKDKT